MLLRSVSAVMAIVASVLAIGMIREDDSSFPLGTARSFSLNTGTSSKAKAELLAGLNRVADAERMVLVKATADLSSSGGARDLVWFGSRAPSSGREVGWFDPSVRGELIPSSRMGDRPLSGNYAMSSCEGCEQAVEDWARAAGVGLQWEDVRSITGFVSGYVNGSGAGFAAVSVVVLLASVIVAWFAGRVRSRSLRLLGGVAPWRIHGLDMRVLGRTVVGWSLAGWVASGVVVLWRYGFDRFATFSLWSLSVLAAVDALAVAGGAVVSCLIRPKAAAIAARRPPLLALVRLGLAVRAVAVVVAVAVIPYAVDYGNAARSARAQAERWRDARGTVTMSLSSLTLEPAYRQEYLRRLGQFADAVQGEGLAALSTTVSAVEVPPERIAPFDRIVMTDEKFLSIMGIGVNRPGPHGALTPVPAAAIPAAARNYLFGDHGSFRMWPNSNRPQKVAYYTYTGGERLPTIGTTLSDADPAKVSHPLIVLVDRPLSSFNPSAVDTFITNGHLIFTDAERLRRLVHAHGLDSAVTSVDSAVGTLLDSAQTYAQQAWMAALATILAGLSVAVAAVQAAHTWAGRNQRRIFARRSAGHSYWRIAAGPLLGETAFIAVAGTLAAAFAAARFELPFGWALAVSCAVAPVYAVGTALAYRSAARRAFCRALRRKT